MAFKVRSFAVENILLSDAGYDEKPMGKKTEESNKK